MWIRAHWCDARIVRRHRDTIGFMIVDGLGVRTLFPEKNLKSNAVASFLSYVERTLGLTIVRSYDKIPFGDASLMEVAHVAEILTRSGILRSLRRSVCPPDEPQTHMWVSEYGEKPSRAGGVSVRSAEEALWKTLGETLERYVWTNATDYCKDPVRATAQEISHKGRFLDPGCFAGFTEHQRATDTALTLLPTARYVWARGTSLVHGAKTFVPAQTVSGSAEFNPRISGEPRIRETITTGLATWKTRAQAQLSGALEVIERDAYMIMWLNQLTLPRIDLTSLTEKEDSLSNILASCARYRLTVHAIQLLTDAPAHAVCIVVQDESGFAPRFALGLKAHRSLSTAIEGALVEALRVRINARNRKHTNHDAPVETIGHMDRLDYWNNPENARKLEFLIAGTHTSIEPSAWEADSPEEHLARIVTWCKEKEYDCVSVSLGNSKHNPTTWYIKNVVIPQLQPMHMHEHIPAIGGERLKSVPEQYGYVVRIPFTDAPHPFV